MSLACFQNDPARASLRDRAVELELPYAHQLARRFRDLAGSVNQRVAAAVGAGEAGQAQVQHLDHVLLRHDALPADEAAVDRHRIPARLVKSIEQFGKIVQLDEPERERDHHHGQRGVVQAEVGDRETAPRGLRIDAVDQACERRRGEAEQVQVRVHEPQPNLAGADEIRLALEKLNVLGSVLMIGAHPDDEHTATLVWLA